MSLCIRKNVVLLGCAGCILVGFILGSEMRSFRDVALCDTARQGTTVERGQHTPDQDGGTENRTAFLAGYKSPVESMFDHFKNKAVERETHKHDRWIVDSLAYLHTFDSAAKYKARGSSEPKPITVVILTVNRAVPYIAVNLATFLRGHTPEIFTERLNVHVANIEKRPERSGYHLVEYLETKLPFITFHNWTEVLPAHFHIKSRKTLYMEQQRIDYIRALEICKQSKSKWCVVMEDDAVPVLNFALKFDKYINLDKYENASLRGTHPYSIEDVAMIKMYVPFNDRGAGKERMVHRNEYAASRYEEDRAIDLKEADARGLPVNKVKYSIKFSLKFYGIVANAYPAIVLDQVMKFLGKGGRVLGQPTDILLCHNFVVSTGKALLETNPSLVNHIGYYSENHDGGKTLAHISTDVRFQLDDGPGDDSEEKRHSVLHGSASNVLIGSVNSKLRRDGA